MALAARKGMVCASFCVSPPRRLQIKNDRNIIFIAAAVAAYLLNRRAAFAGSLVAHGTAFPRFAAVAALGAILNGSIVAATLSAVDTHYMYAQLAATAVALSVTYGINKAWTFAS